MFGDNPILKPESGDGSVLKVHEMFETFQGEGPYAGYPAFFIRLFGCNLACSFCDTDFSSYNEISVSSIIAKLRAQLPSNSHDYLVVITGGEPMRQPIGLLCQKLLSIGMRVQIESNGLLYREIPQAAQIVCSPKNTRGKYHTIQDSILEHTIAIKFLISANNPFYFDIADVGQSKYCIPVYVQPMDEYDAQLNQSNVKRAMEIAKTHGAVLSLQLHKIINIK